VSGIPLKLGEACVLHFGVISQADPNVFQANPTIAAGDFLVSNDDGATFNNVAALPSIVAGSTKVIQAPLSAAEMTPSVGDTIIFVGSDQAGAEWQDIMIVMTVTPYPLSELVSVLLTTLAKMPAVSGALREADIGPIYRGDTWTQRITGMGDLTGNADLWFALKDDKDKTDAQATVLISRTVGLEVLNGAAVTDPVWQAYGSITVVGLPTAGLIEIELDENVTALLAASKRYYWDAQKLVGGSVTTPRGGECLAEADVVRTVT
jgi:hypothetical protein